MRRLTLGPAHYPILVAGIGLALAAWLIVAMPDVKKWYLGSVVIPRLERAYGFRGGVLSFEPGWFEAWGIVELTPGSRLAALGMRPGDAPISLGTDFMGMYRALRDGERRRFALFKVLNVEDWKAGRQWEFRTIVAYPPSTDLAVGLGLGSALSSPSGRFSLVGLGDRPNQPFNLNLRNLRTRTDLEIGAHKLRVSAVWSSDERWIALTDEDHGVGRCRLFDTTGAVVADISALAGRLSELSAEEGVGDPLSCDVFGWVRGTSNVAVRLQKRGDGEYRDYFFDAASQRFTRGDS